MIKKTIILTSKYLLKKYRPENRLYRHKKPEKESQAETRHWTKKNQTEKTETKSIKLKIICVFYLYLPTNHVWPDKYTFLVSIFNTNIAIIDNRIRINAFDFS